MSTTFPDHLAIIWHGDDIEFSFLERKLTGIKFEPLSSLCGKSERHRAEITQIYPFRVYN